ncbi:hypothetical protein BT63DRAFT_481127 [Microthyrium microscopicum]|uniref:Uncharacterized protein n=1 Tax=Microthyrium microscopicum TaxID=703497 RepID=A0A6A6U6Q5_9PEZI|nr:hypothetical protein BT63DRAFT_481127 [Microthyrium microscopicum]
MPSNDNWSRAQDALDARRLRKEAEKKQEFERLRQISRERRLQAEGIIQAKEDMDSLDEEMAEEKRASSGSRSPKDSASLVSNESNSPISLKRKATESQYEDDDLDSLFNGSEPEYIDLPPSTKRAKVDESEAPKPKTKMDMIQKAHSKDKARRQMEKKSVKGSRTATNAAPQGPAPKHAIAKPKSVQSKKRSRVDENEYNSEDEDFIDDDDDHFGHYYVAEEEKPKRRAAKRNKKAKKPLSEDQQDALERKEREKKRAEKLAAERGPQVKPVRKPLPPIDYKGTMRPSTRVIAPKGHSTLSSTSVASKQPTESGFHPIGSGKKRARDGEDAAPVPQKRTKTSNTTSRSGDRQTSTKASNAPMEPPNAVKDGSQKKPAAKPIMVGMFNLANKPETKVKKVPAKKAEKVRIQKVQKAPPTAPSSPNPPIWSWAQYFEENEERLVAEYKAKKAVEKEASSTDQSTSEEDNSNEQALSPMPSAKAPSKAAEIAAIPQKAATKPVLANGKMSLSEWTARQKKQLGE